MSRVFWSMHLHYTAILFFFSWNLKNIFLHEIWRIFPRSFDIVEHLMSLQDIKYFVQNKGESSLFFIDNIQHVMWPFLNDFILPAAWRVFVRKHLKVCYSLLQWSNIGTAIWCITCTVRFFGSLLRIFSSFPPICVCKIEVLWKVASSCAEDLKPDFLYLAEYSVKNFITRQYLVNLM